ncbi:MAG: hypothetical protein NT167_11610, partial [Verrucomicrobia bacterium]|nr:hypothetical protein [Verrucomicrobiota bacterium]
MAWVYLTLEQAIEVHGKTVESAYLLCSSDFQVGFCLPEDQLLDQPVEKFADMFGTSAVETKRVFVE